MKPEVTAADEKEKDANCTNELILFFILMEFLIWLTLRILQDYLVNLVQNNVTWCYYHFAAE